jgi:hypothetical protein
VKRWATVIASSLLVVTLMLVWADECQTPTTNCPPHTNEGRQADCSDGRRCRWRVSGTEKKRGEFCTKNNSICPNHNPRAGNCTEREIWELTVEDRVCRADDGTSCRSVRCVAKVKKIDDGTGTDCRGHPCPGHPKVPSPRLSNPPT